MGNDEFLKIAVEEVRRYTEEHLENHRISISMLCGCARHFKTTRHYYQLHCQTVCILKQLIMETKKNYTLMPIIN